jgi:hypothetical protein
MACTTLNNASSPIVPYEPDIVQLTGILYESICPGPPEYTSIEMGDAPEHNFVLQLNSPIHVRDINFKENSWNEPEDDISAIQVALSPEDAQYFVNKPVVITGSLFHAGTAHHRTEVIMLNNQIDIIK